MDRESAAALVEEYLAGGTMREVAGHHGVSAKLVQRAMRQLGAATRSPEERAGYPAQVERWARRTPGGSPRRRSPRGPG